MKFYAGFVLACAGGWKYLKSGIRPSMVHISNKLGGLNFILSYGDIIQHLWLLRWSFTFSTFSEKDCLSSNQIKSKQNFKKLNGHNVSIELPIWTILSLNLSVQNSSTILPFFSKLQRKFSPISTKPHWDFTFPSTIISYVTVDLQNLLSTLVSHPKTASNIV